MTRSQAVIIKFVDRLWPMMTMSRFTRTTSLLSTRCSLRPLVSAASNNKRVVKVMP